MQCFFIAVKKNLQHVTTVPVTKTILITGASDGLGKETAFCMAELGFNLVLVGRNRAKLEQVAAEIGKVHQVQISLYVADLSSVKAVLELANDLNKNLDQIDVLLNNAGAFFNSYQSNSEGIEQTFALNHLSYFSLQISFSSGRESRGPHRECCIKSSPGC